MSLIYYLVLLSSLVGDATRLPSERVHIQEQPVRVAVWVRGTDIDTDRSNASRELGVALQALVRNSGGFILEDSEVTAERSIGFPEDVHILGSGAGSRLRYEAIFSGPNGATSRVRGSCRRLSPGLCASQIWSRFRIWRPRSGASFPSEVLVRGTDIRTEPHNVTLRLRDALEALIAGRNPTPGGIVTKIYLPDDVALTGSDRFRYRVLLVDAQLRTLRSKSGMCRRRDTNNCARTILHGLGVTGAL